MDKFPLYVGDIIDTSYGTGPYEVVKILGPCICPLYLDRIEGISRSTPEHFHIVCVRPGEKMKIRNLYCLNHYAERNDKIVSINQRSKQPDEIVIVKRARNAQMRLFW